MGCNRDGGNLKSWGKVNGGWPVRANGALPNLSPRSFLINYQELEGGTHSQESRGAVRGLLLLSFQDIKDPRTKKMQNQNKSNQILFATENKNQIFCLPH